MQQTKLQGVSIGLSGNELKLGDKAPVVSLVAADLSEVKVGGGTGKAQVIIAVPSLDTDVCATETRKFNERAASIKNTEVFVVSMDLPFAAGWGLLGSHRFFGAIHVLQNLLPLSAFVN